MKKNILYLSVIILIVIVAMSSGNNNNDEKEEVKTENSSSQEQQTVPVFQKQEQDIKAHATQYTIVNEEDLSIKAMDKLLSSYTQEELAQLPLNIRMMYSIIIPSNIKKDELKATLIKVTKEKIQENQDIDEIAVFAYDNEQDIDGFYTFGKIEWCPNGKWDDVTPIIASTNNRNSYEYVFDIKEKVGQEEDKPTTREIEIYNMYWEKLDESGNPRGYTNHPTTLEASNEWEKVRIQQVLDVHNISHDKLFDIIIKVSIWKLK